MSERDAEIEHAGYDECLNALEDGAGYYLECENDHANLPPRRVCPECGSTELTEASLPESGEVETYTVTHVPTPAFEEDAPYATAIARFGPIRITGCVQEAALDALEVGAVVSADVDISETTGDRLLVFRRR